jgi:hypothetical protein
MQKRIISSVHLAGESLEWSEVDTLERRAEVWTDCVFKAAPGSRGQGYGSSQPPNYCTLSADVTQTGAQLNGSMNLNPFGPRLFPT